MRELFERLKSANINKIFYEKSDSIFVQLFRYVFVGGIAFIADWGALVMFHEQGMDVYVATAIAFLFGLAVNFILTKIFVFKEKSDKTNAVGEFATYAIIGVIGLLFTEILMWAFLNIGIYYMISKVIAAILVLVWNFAARKFLLYR